MGILGPGPPPDRGGTLGGMACQPPRPRSLVVGETCGGSPMLIMSTASLSTPLISTFAPRPPLGLYCPGSMGGGVLYWYWGETGPPLPPPPPPPPPRTLCSTSSSSAVRPSCNREVSGGAVAALSLTSFTLECPLLLEEEGGARPGFLSRTLSPRLEEYHSPVFSGRRLGQRRRWHSSRWRRT